MNSEDVDWTGTGWRIWRHGRGGLLRNPWTNSRLECWWWPGEVQVAECFYRDGGRPFGGWRLTCQGLVSETCTCGVRSMATLTNLAAFLAKDDQLARHPDKAAVVGRVRIGGRVQHRIPFLPASEGYQRSEYAEIIGPLYVSPRAGSWADYIRSQYSPIEVIGPDRTPAADSQQEWLEKLAGHLSPAHTATAGLEH